MNPLLGRKVICCFIFNKYFNPINVIAWMERIWQPSFIKAKVLCGMLTDPTTTENFEKGVGSWVFELKAHLMWFN